MGTIFEFFKVISRFFRNSSEDSFTDAAGFHCNLLIIIHQNSILWRKLFQILECLVILLAILVGAPVNFVMHCQVTLMSHFT